MYSDRTEFDEVQTQLQSLYFVDDKFLENYFPLCENAPKRHFWEVGDSFQKTLLVRYLSLKIFSPTPFWLKKVFNIVIDMSFF